MATIVFDLDGTLVDTAPDLRTATNAVLAEHGRRALSLDETRSFVGRGAATLLQRAFDATGGPVAEPDALYESFLTHYAAHLTDASRPYPGAGEVLEGLAADGHALGVCTNKPEQPARRLLQALGLARFFGDVVVGGDSLPVRKPHPAPVLDTIARLRGTADDAVLVGDSATDVAAGRAAGVPVIAVRWGYRGGVSAEDLGADELVSHFSALPGALLHIVDAKDASRR